MLQGKPIAGKIVSFLLSIPLCYALLVLCKPLLMILQHDWGFGLATIAVIVIVLLLLSAIVGFAIYRTHTTSSIKQMALNIYWPTILLTPTMAFAEAYLHSTGHNEGFETMYSYMRYTEHFEENHQYFADSIGITKANAKYYKTHHPEVYINNEGFRSREFTDTCAGQQRLLMLGDSFLWGLAAEPQSACFADLLDAEYCIYNTGIIGAAPNQYEAIATTYIPQLKPHITCLFLFAGNDILFFDAPLRPFVPNNFWTEGMGLSSVINEGCGEIRYFDTADTAYSYFLNRFSLHTRKSWFLKALSFTHVGTYLYFLIKSPNTPPSCDEYNKNLKPITLHYLQRIKALAEQHHSKFLLFVIPEKNAIPTTLDELYDRYPCEFDGFKPYLPLNLTTSDYALGGDMHFNNEGHAKYASFVKEVLEAETQYIK